jgi:hypothetical protein
MIHRVIYNWEYSKEDIIKKVYQNKSIKKDLSGNTSPNTDEILFYCKEFNSIHKFIVNEYYKIKQIANVDYALNMWTYIQNKNTNDEVFHRHLRLDGGRSEIQTEYTFVFYLQIPTNLKDGEGDLLIKWDNETINTLSPSEGEIIFFPGDIWHTPKSTPNAEIDRIVIAGNITSNFLTKKGLV